MVNRFTTFEKHQYGLSMQEVLKLTRTHQNEIHLITFTVYSQTKFHLNPSCSFGFE
jgi:hypothetical protein